MTHLPPSSPSTLLTIKGKEYAPEDFGLDWKTVYAYREKMFSSDEELASGRVEESDGLFLYARNKKYDSTGKENGGWYFSQVPGDGNYNTYITEEEKRLFGNESILKLLAKYDVFIEYGPGIGDANKLRKRVLENRQFAHFRKKVRGVIRHLGLDASTYTADQFNKEYQNNTTIHGECIPTEWSKSSIPKDIPNAAHVMLGGTPGAHSREQLIQLIRSMGSGSHVHKSPLLLSFFSAPQEPDKKIKIEHIKDAYRCDAAKNFVMKGIEALGVPIDNCEYVVDYQEGSGKTPDRIRVGAKLRKSITVDVGGGKKMTKKAGEYIWAVSSRRYTDEQFTDILKEAGTTGVKLHGEGGIKVAESYLPRKKFSDKVRRRAKNIGYILAGTALLSYGAHEYGKYRKLRDARAYALQEIAYKNIRYPTVGTSSYYQLSEVVNDNLSIESREQRLDFITNHIYDIATTEYRNYPFPDEEFVKAAIMRYIPENIDYFTHSKGPDEYFLSFVHHVLMPHLFSFFGNGENIGLYDWTKEEDIANLLHDARSSTEDFEIDKFAVDGLGGDRTGVTKTYDLTDLGYVYMVDEKGMLKKVRIGYVTMLHHEWISQMQMRTKQGEKILIAGTEEDGFSAATAREFLTFMNEKGYASLLTDKIMYVLDPIQVSEEYDVVKKQIRNYILELNRTGYDLSRLCRGDKDSEIKKLIVGFLANQSAELHESIAGIVSQSGVHLDADINFVEQVEKMVHFLKVYYGHNGGGLGKTEKDYVGLRNFLLQVVISGYLEDINSSRSRRDEPLLPQNIVITLRRLSQKLETFGFDLNESKNALYVLKDFYDNYEQYKGKKPQTMYRIYSSLDELYTGNVIFTTDGRCFIVSGASEPIAGFELTEENCYEKMEGVLEMYKEKFSQEMFSAPYDTMPAIQQRIVYERALNEIQWKYLLPTYEGAYELAKGIGDFGLK